MFVGCPINISHHGRHIGQSAYVHRLMCRPDRHKRVYPAPPFLSPASLSHTSLPTRCIAMRTAAATTAPRAAATPGPAPAAPDPSLTRGRPAPPGRRLPDRARPRPCPTRSALAGASPVAPDPGPPSTLAGASPTAPDPGPPSALAGASSAAPDPAHPGQHLPDQPCSTQPRSSAWLSVLGDAAAPVGF
jgi:hypothetical protein